MEHKQVGLPFPIPNSWEKMEPDRRNRGILIMARMIKKIIEVQRRGDDNGKKAESSNP